MSEVIEYTPAIVNVSGATATERKLSVVTGASHEATLALTNLGGKVGKVARQHAAATGLVGICEAAARGNFKPVAEYIATRTGKAVVISSKASFEALPDLFEAQILNAKNAKNGGYTTTKAGIIKPTAALSLAMELKAFAVETVRRAGLIAEHRAAERRAQRAALES